MGKTTPLEKQFARRQSATVFVGKKPAKATKRVPGAHQSIQSKMRSSTGFRSGSVR